MPLQYVIASFFVSTLLAIVEIHGIDLQHDDDNVDFLFLTGRQPLDCECLSASSLLWLLETGCVTERRELDLTR